MTIEFFDAHTHLNEDRLFSSWEEHLDAFVKHGGKGLIIAGANHNYNKRVGEILNHHTLSDEICWIRGTLGYHPCDVEAITDKKTATKELEKSIVQHKHQIVAIGECGIDLHYDQQGLTYPWQKEIFDAQCQLARNLKLPIVIHSRDAFKETIEILKNYSDLKIYFHCRGYGPQEIQEVLAIFPQVFFGYCGNITYSTAEKLRSSLLETPKDRMLLETDAPYLTPQAFRGTLNSPEKIKATGSFVADLLSISEAKLWEQVKENFFALYNN